jgi:hypothetical protein
VESLAAIDSLLFSIHYFRHSGWMTAQPRVTPNSSWLPPGDRSEERTESLVVNPLQRFEFCKFLHPLAKFSCSFCRVFPAFGGQ